MVQHFDSIILDALSFLKFRFYNNCRASTSLHFQSSLKEVINIDLLTIDKWIVCKLTRII